jgi:hypothetical protein
VGAEHPLTRAVAHAPTSPGIYAFLGEHGELLYIGKANAIATRLRQHLHNASRPESVRLDLLYQRVREVRWEAAIDAPAAADREADLIVALRPPFNASHAYEGRWNYVALQEHTDDASRVRFLLGPEPPDDDPANGRRAYGCFPHLGRGVSSPRGIACSDGYTALLRLCWMATAPPRAQIPSRITRAAPDDFDVRVEAELQRPLHDLLSGTSDRVLGLCSPHPDRADLGPSAVVDRTAAHAFSRHGPRALRDLRRRHGVRHALLSRAEIEALVAADLRASIGAFDLPPAREPTDNVMGRRAHPWLHQGPGADQAGS